MSHVKTLAHRGDARHAPDNTMAAFRNAVSLGADGFEFDVRLSADGVPIIYHNMMIGDYFIADLDLAELQAMSVQKNGEVHPIPTLAEVLDEFAGKTYLEIHLQADTRELVGAVCAMLKQFPQLSDLYELTTFEPAIIQAIHQYDRGHPCDMLFRLSDWMTDEMALRLQIDKAKLADARGVHLFAHQINSDVIRRFDSLGMSLHCGVVDNKETYQRIQSLGVTQILTDDLNICLDAGN